MYKETEGDGSSTDSPWMAGGSDVDAETVFKYPPELLGTSWGSYLFSGPPTAHGRSGRKVVIAEHPRTCSPGTDGRSGVRVPPAMSDQSSPKRGILRTPVVKSDHPAVVASESPVAPRTRATPTGASQTAASLTQPHPLFRHLLAALQAAQEGLDSCGVDNSPLSEACKLVRRKQHEVGGSHDTTTTTTEDDAQSCELANEECVKAVLEALVLQAGKMQEHALSLQQTAAVLSRSRRQFAREQQDMQQAMEAALSYIVTQKQLLEEKKEALSKQRVRVNDGQRSGSDKTYLMGLKEGQHKLALARAQKEHSRLEKVLLQQQRELEKLQQANKITKSELAAEQHSSQELHKRFLQSEFHGKPVHHRRIDRLRKKFNDHSQHLHQLEHQFEASRLQLLETGCRLRGEGMDRHGRNEGAGNGEGHTLNLPSIAKKGALPLDHNSSKQHEASSTDQFSLPKLHQPTAPAPRDHSERSRTTYNFSRSELMALAKFRSPEAAEQVISWLEKGGKLNSGNYS